MKPTSGSNKSRQLNVGVLGCGPISQFAHFEACRKARNANLYAICDVADDLVERMTAIHQSSTAYTDYDEMLADPNVEAVIIGIADQFHVTAAIKAIDAGKHALVEKPMGVSVEECEDLRARVRDSGLVLQVGTEKRFDPGITFANQFICNEMGELLALKAWYCDSVYRYSMTDTLQPIPVTSDKIKRPPGNPKADRQRYYLLGHGSHLLDTARFLGGEIISLRARHVEKFGAYCWFAEAEFANGAVGHLDLTISVRMDWHEGFQVYGEHGSVVGKTYNPWYRRASDVECFSTRDHQYHRPLGADADFFRLQIEGFADAVLNDTPMQGADVDDGVAAMRGMVALARSAESDERVHLADIAGSI